MPRKLEETTTQKVRPEEEQETTSKQQNYILKNLALLPYVQLYGTPKKTIGRQIGQLLNVQKRAYTNELRPSECNLCKLNFNVAFGTVAKHSAASCAAIHCEHPKTSAMSYVHMRDRHN